MLNQDFAKKYSSGFTLIETFVAITILMIAVLGPMSTIAKFYADSTYAKNQIAATFLAQDGMETVINLIRNNTELRRQALGGGANCSETADWLEGVQACKEENGCKVDSLLGAVETCDADGGSCPVYRRSDDFYYQSLPGDNTIFTRYVKISNIDSPAYSDVDYSSLRRSAQVTAWVWWQEKGRTHGPVVVSSLIVQNQCP
jgi:type II secretory pathway pseudopilin PulG